MSVSGIRHVKNLKPYEPDEKTNVKTQYTNWMNAFTATLFRLFSLCRVTEREKKESFKATGHKNDDIYFQVCNVRIYFCRCSMLLFSTKIHKSKCNICRIFVQNICNRDDDDAANSIWKKNHSGFFLDFSILERLMSHGQNVFSGTTHIFTMNERRRYDAMYGILFFSDDNIYRTPNVLYSTKALDKVTIFPFLVWIGVAAENFKIWYNFISEIYIDSVVQQKTKCECWIKIFLVTIQFNGFLFCYRWNDK